MKFRFDSERLRFRPLHLNDVGFVHELLMLPETDRYNALGIPDSFEQTQRWAESWVNSMEVLPPLAHTLIIESLDDDTPIGLYGLKLSPAKYRRTEIWYKLHKKHWGQGFGTESTRRAIEFCFDDLDLHRVEAGVAVGNEASVRVLEKAGFLREGRLRENLPLVSGFSDSFIYSVLRDDFERARSSKN